MRLPRTRSRDRHRAAPRVPRQQRETNLSAGRPRERPSRPNRPDAAPGGIFVDLDRGLFPAALVVYLATDFGGGVWRLACVPNVCIRFLPEKFWRIRMILSARSAGSRWRSLRSAGTSPHSPV